jgi:CHAD domain-containing protein
MGYAFEQDDATLQVSLRRIARAELSQAIDRFSQVDEPQSVHAIRKHLKKVRALLRLVRSGLADQPEENAALRAIGLALATRRDAAVRLTSFHLLFPDPPKVLRPLLGHLAADSQPVASLPPDLPDALRAIRKRARHWSLDGKDKAILKQGLTETRAKAIRAAKAARAEPGSGPLFHEWRKQVQQHWFQARLFAPCWPDLFKPIVDSADHLGEMLGNHHDLSVLASHVAGLPATLVSDPARGMFGDRLRDAQALIEAEAYPLGGRLFAGDPDAVVALWLDWRRLWLGQA